MEEAVLSITTGLMGLFGAMVMRPAVGERLLKAHCVVSPEQKTLSRPPARVTLLPGIRFALFNEELKVMVTVAAVVHVHVVREALVKLKSLLHGHVAVTMLAESVKVLNVTKTAWPLSENLLDIITGGDSPK